MSENEKLDMDEIKKQKWYLTTVKIVTYTVAATVVILLVLLSSVMFWGLFYVLDNIKGFIWK